MLTRTIISLEPGQLRALRARARAEGISVAELVRRLVAQGLAAERVTLSVPSSSFERFVGLGSSGRGDVADRHDALLGEALRKDHDG